MIKNQRKKTDRRQLRAGRIGTTFLVSAALLLTACGSDDNATSTSTVEIACAGGALDGAGSTFVQPIVQQWVKEYQGACPGVTLNYKGVGSGSGITQFNQGAVYFAATDVPLSKDEEGTARAKYGDVTTVPWASAAVALEYKLSGVEEVRLSPNTIAGIFNGTIRQWNDPSINADNVGRQMPQTPIQVMHRSDGSGTTAVFTQWMTANAPDVWKVGAGKDVPWPTGQGLKGSDGVTAAVKQTEGAIGYSELSYATSNALPTVRVKNVAGEFVAPDAKDAVAVALSESGIDADAKVTPNYKPNNAKAYPLATFTYVVLPKGTDERARLMQSFVNYAVTDGQKSAEPLSYAPLPDNVVDKVKTKLAAASTP